MTSTQFTLIAIAGLIAIYVFLFQDGIKYQWLRWKLFFNEFVMPALLLLLATSIAVGMACAIFVGYVLVFVVIIAAVVSAIVFPALFIYKWLFT